MARDLLQRAACLAPGEPIPHALLVATLGLAEDDLDAALACEDALRRLLDIGLLDAPEPGTYRIHHLVAVFAQETDGYHAAARAAVEQILLHGARRVNATGKRRDTLRQRARAQAEQVLALLHVLDANAYFQPLPGHRDALLAHARHVIRVIDRSGRTRQAA